MEQLQSYKKKVLFYCAAPIIAEHLVRLIANIIIINVMPVASLEEGYDPDRYNTIQTIVSLCITAFAIALTFIVGYAFTGSKKKTVVFAGSVYFGRQASGIVESFISSAAYSLNICGVITTSVMSSVIFIGNILDIAVSVAIAWFAFTAFEGINPRLGGSLDESGMLLSRARKRLIIAHLIVAVVVAAVSNAPTFIFALVDVDMRYSFIISVLSYTAKWIGGVAGFAMLYFVGYRPCKRHHDAMAFIGAGGIANTVIGFFTAAVMLPINIFYQSLINEGNYQMVALFSGLTGAVSLIATVAEIVFIIYVLKFFFAKAKITLFEQEPVLLQNQEFAQEIYEAPSAVMRIEDEGEREEATEESNEE